MLLLFSDARDFVENVIGSSRSTVLSALRSPVDRRRDVVSYVGAAVVEECAPKPPPPSFEFSPEIFARYREDELRVEYAAVGYRWENADVAREKMTAPAVLLHTTSVSSSCRCCD